MSNLKKAVHLIRAAQSVRGFLYGHYDSRGGTVFVVANNRKQADLAYLEEIFSAGPELLKEAEEDFLDETTLYYTGSLPESADLEDDGYVLAEGSHKLEDWDESEELPGGPVATPIGALEYVEKGSQPVTLKDGWQHPWWDDDGWSFILVEAGPAGETNA